MSTESALHTPSSRDPRLANGRPPARFSLANLPAPQYPNSPNPPQPAVQNDVGCDDFIRGISGLVRATIVETQNKAEKDRLQKQRDSTERLWRRAKAHPSFPATIEFYQRARDAEDAEISRVDRALEESSRRQLEKELRDRFPSSTSGDKVPELETEVNAAKNEISRLMEKNQSLETMLGDKVSELKTTFKDQSNMQGEQNREVKERLDHHQALTENAETKSTTIIADIQGLYKENSTMNSRVEQLWKSYTDSVAQNTEKTKEQQKKLDRLKLHDIESIRKDLFDLKARVLSFENNHVSARQADQRVPHEALQQLISRVQKLEGAPSLTPRVDKLDSLLQELKDIHAFSDDLHFAEKEKIQRALEHQVIVSDRMTNDIARLSNQLQSVHQTNPNNQEIANLGANLHQTRRTLETVKVGMHSLETRYNSLSTETVVKNMVAAMQEMYPNIGQLTDQTSRLKKVFEKELPPVLAKIDNIDERLQSHISTTRDDLSPMLARIDSVKEALQSQISAAREGLSPLEARIDSVDERLRTHISAIRQDATVRLDELNRLRNDHSCLSQSLAPLWDRFKSLGDLPSNEEFSKLRANLDSLMGKVSQYPPEDESSTLGDLEVLKSKFNVLEQTMGGFRTSFTTQLDAKADDDTIRQTVDKERDRLLGRINGVSTQTKELAQSLAELKVVSTSNEEDGMESVRDTISQLQESMLDKYQFLCKELDEIKTAMSSNASGKSTSTPGQDDSAPSREQTQIPKRESPAFEGAGIKPDPETSPALALREQKKKKKRSRASSLAHEGMASASPSGSPMPSPPAPDETPESRKRKKKKRKIEEPVIID